MQLPRSLNISNVIKIYEPLKTNELKQVFLGAIQNSCSEKNWKFLRKTIMLDSCSRNVTGDFQFCQQKWNCIHYTSTQRTSVSVYEEYP